MAVIGLDDKPLITGLKSSGRKAEQEAGKIGKDAGGALGDEAGGELQKSGGGKLSGALSKLGPVLMKGAAALGVAAGAVAAKGFADALGQEQATDRMAGQLGLSPEQSAAAGEIAGKLYMDAYTGSFQEGADTVGAIISSFGKDATPDEIERWSKKAAVLFDTFEVDASETASAVGVLLNNGLAKDADSAFDLITASMQSMPAAMRGELLPIIDEFAVQLAGAGFSGEDAMGLIVAASENGKFAIDKTVDAIKEFHVKAADGSSAEAIKALGVPLADAQAAFAKGGDSAANMRQRILDSLQSVESESEKVRLGQLLMGSQWEDLGGSLDPSGVIEGLSGVAGSLGDTSGAADELGKQMRDNLGTRIEMVKNRVLGGLATFIETKLLPVIDKFAKSETFQKWVDTAREAFSRFGDGLRIVASWVQETLWPTLQNVGAWMSETFGPIVESLANLWEQVLWPALQKVWDIIETYLWPAWLKIADVMVNTVIPAVAGLIAKFYDAATWIGVKIGEIVGWVVGLPGRIRDTISNLWEGLKERTGNVKDWVVEKFDSIVTFITDMPGKISTAASGMWDGIKNAFKSALNWIIDKWNGLEFEFPEMNLGPLGKVGGWTLGPPDIPRFHTGGRVPGGPSSESLAILQGGEAVLTQRHQAALGEVISMFGTRANADLGSVGRSYGSPASVTPISQAPSVRGGTTINNTVNVETNADPWKIASATAFTTSHSGVA